MNTTQDAPLNIPFTGYVSLTRVSSQMRPVYFRVGITGSVRVMYRVGTYADFASVELALAEHKIDTRHFCAHLHTQAYVYEGTTIGVSCKRAAVFLAALLGNVAA